MANSDEDSFLSAMKSTGGVVAALVIIFGILPCMTCGGMAVCGKALEEADQEEAAPLE